MAVAGRRLSRSTKLLYGAGSIAYGVKLQALGSLLLLYFNQVIGLPSAWVGLILMLALILDAISDPLVGQWSDNLSSAWGRRHPFMYASALPAAVAFFFLWHPSLDWPKEALAVHLAFWLIALRLIITFYETPSTALAPELAPDYDERTRLLSYRHLFQSVGGIGMTALTYMVLLRPTAADPSGVLNREGYGQYGLIGAVIIFFIILLSTAGTHREIPHLTRPPARKLGLRGMASEMAATLSNRNFLVMTLSVLIASIALGLTGALGLYINSYFWQLKAQSIALVVGVGIFSTAFGVYFGPQLTARYGKKRTALVIYTAALLTNAWPLIAALVGLTPPPGSTPLIVLLVVNNAIVSVLTTIGAIATVSMLADVVEESQVQTGRRSEGLLMSADNLIQKSISGVGIFLSGLMLAVIGFPENAVPGQVDPAIVRRLILFYVPIQFILSAISVASLGLYRINRSDHEDHLRKTGQLIIDEAPANPAAQETPEGLPKPV